MTNINSTSELSGSVLINGAAGTVSRRSARIALLVLLAACGVLYLGYQGIQQRLQQTKAMAALEIRVEQTLALSNLLYELQIEHGLAVTFRSGEGSSFQQPWQQQQARTDNYLAQLPAGASNFRQLDLDALRAAVPILTPLQVLDAYSDLNASLITELERLARLERAEMSPELAAHLSFVRFKEYAGKERALLSQVLQQRRLAGDTLQRYLEILAGQQAHEAAFLSLTTAVGRDRYLTGLTEHHEQLARIRSLLLSGNWAALPAVTDWFAISSARIEALQGQYQHLAADLLTRAKTLSAQAQAHINLVLILVLLVLIAGAALALQEARRAERLALALQAQKTHAERLALIARYTRKMAVIADANGRIEWVNEGFEQLSGYKLEEVKGKTPGSLFGGPNKDAETQTKLREAVRLGLDVDVEVLNYTKEGSPIWVRIELRALRDLAGTLVGFIALETDISERMALLASLQAANARAEDAVAHLAKAQEVANMGSWSLDMQADRLLWSQQTYRIFGDPDLPAPTFADFIAFVHPDDLRLVTNAWEGAVQGRPYDIEHRVIVGGQVKHLREVAAVEFDVQGKPVSATGTVQDISDRKRLEAQLLESQKMEALGKLTGGIAHDFNNLLQVILGSAEDLEVAVQEEAQSRHAQMIRVAAERAADLTSQLLSFARHQMLQSETLDLGAAVNQMLPLLTRLLPEYIDVQVRIPDAPVLVDADRSQLENALLNLVINARDAMERQGILSLQVDLLPLDTEQADSRNLAPGAYGRLRVTDTGAGMSKEVAARAFEPFFTTKAVGRGTGLGLSMVYGFAKQSGGHAEILSKPGEGTSISVLLPIHRPPPA